MSRLPVLNALIGLTTPAIPFFAIPLLGAILLTQGRVDGRPLHHVLMSLLRWWVGPRWLAGLSPCPAPGQSVLPLDGVVVAHDGRESFSVRGRIRGPAKVTFRYPAVVRVEGAPPWVRDPKGRSARAKRYRVQRRPDSAPMIRGKVVKVPRGREVLVE